MQYNSIYNYICLYVYCQLGHTPLHQAAQQGHVLIIKLLLRYHANPDALTTVSRRVTRNSVCGVSFL